MMVYRIQLCRGGVCGVFSQPGSHCDRISGGHDATRLSFVLQETTCRIISIPATCLVLESSAECSSASESEGEMEEEEEEAMVVEWRPKPSNSALGHWEKHTTVRDTPPYLPAYIVS